MIDIHCHILPGVDDGAKTLEESLEMCRMAAADGVTTIVGTPHQHDGVYNTPSATILAKVQLLNAALKQAQIPLTILPGADVYIDVNTVDKITNGEIMTINQTKRYFLLEFPAHTLPTNIENIVFNLMLKNVVPILTHPERIGEVQQHPNRVYDLVSLGVLSQITAMSLTGGFGRHAQKCAKTLVEHNLAHIIASDAHSIESRPPILTKGVKEAAKIIGKEQALAMVTTIPQQVISGKPVEDLEPPIPIKRGWFG